jgi:hypothetical protein
MEVNFEIKRIGYLTTGNLFFRIEDKINHFIFNIHLADCHDCTCINSYYFSYDLVYGFGNKIKYFERSNCFRNIANKLYTDRFLHIFDLNINKEFEFIEKRELKQYFLEINKIIISKMKKYIKKYIKNKCIKESNDYISDLTDDEDY